MASCSCISYHWLCSMFCNYNEKFVLLQDYFKTPKDFPASCKPLSLYFFTVARSSTHTFMNYLVQIFRVVPLKGWAVKFHFSKRRQSPNNVFYNCFYNSISRWLSPLFSRGHIDQEVTNKASFINKSLYRRLLNAKTVITRIQTPCMPKYKDACAMCACTFKVTGQRTVLFLNSACFLRKALSWSLPCSLG